jgi:hypothetical protein
MTPTRIECEVHFERRGRGCKELAAGVEPAPTPPGRVPRVARLLALAHRLERLVRTGSVPPSDEGRRPMYLATVDSATSWPSNRISA